MKKRLFCLAITAIGILLLNSQSTLGQPYTWNVVGDLMRGSHITTTADGKILVSSGGAGLWYSPDNGTTWQNLGLSGKDLRQSVVNASGHIFIVGPGIWRSTDGGMTWVEKDSGLTSKPSRTIAINANGDLFVGTWLSSVYRSTDNGESWVPLTSGMTGWDFCDIVIGPDGTIFVGSGYGLFRSTNNGDSWTPINNGLSNTAIATLALDASGNLFAGTWNECKVFRSSDKGDNWTDVSAGLTGTDAHDIAIGNGCLFVTAYPDDIYQSTDNGNTWTALGGPIHQAFFYQLAVTVDNHLLASSASGALLRSENAVPLVSVEDAAEWKPATFWLHQNFPNPFNPSTTIRYGLSIAGAVKLDVFNPLGQHISSLVNTYQEAGYYEVDFDATALPSGMYLCRLQAGDLVATKKMLHLK